MLRLLLPDAKKELQHEYCRRWLIVLLSVLSVVFLMWGFSLLPTVLLLQSEESVLREQLRVATDPEINKDREQVKQQLQVVSRQLQLLTIPEYHISALLQEITNAQSDSVALSTIAVSSEYSPTDKTTRGILTITGVAERRTDVIAYTNMLRQKADFFQAVDLPFASLVKDTDIPFTITITLVPYTLTTH